METDLRLKAWFLKSGEAVAVAAAVSFTKLRH